MEPTSMTPGAGASVTSSASAGPVLDVAGLTVSYPGLDGAEARIEVVHGIDLTVGQGERLALVGESGSGKSVTARTVLQLDDDAQIGGSVRVDGVELVGARSSRLRQIRGGVIGLVFQDPLTALNPVMRIGWQIMQPLVIRGVPKAQARQRGIELLRRLGVKDADERFTDYPHQFSGGMRQRVVIAIAVIAEPRLLIADEPTTALDVRVQSRVLELLRDVADERGMSVLLITHDLGVVAGFADRVAVMRYGTIVESAEVDTLYRQPRHAYTKGLLGAVPRIDADPSMRLVTVDDFEEADSVVESGVGGPMVSGGRVERPADEPGEEN